MSIQQSEKEYWVPLESNPEVMTEVRLFVTLIYLFKFTKYEI